MKLSRVIQRSVLRSVSALQSSNAILSIPVGIQCRHKTWASSDPQQLQKLTEQALIHDISLHQLETGSSPPSLSIISSLSFHSFHLFVDLTLFFVVKEVVPWFLKSMPVMLIPFLFFDICPLTRIVSHLNAMIGFLF